MNQLDKYLTEISTIVGIIGTMSAWPIFKLIRAWLQRRQHSKTERLAFAISKANKPVIETYEREHAAVIEDIEIVKQSLIASLHDRIYDEGNRLLNQGYATIDEVNNFNYLYEAYHERLDGNGTGEVINMHVRELPIRDGNTAYVKEASELHKERESQTIE